MRTGIYVYQATTVTFSSNESLELVRYPDDTIAIDKNPMTLDPGIYKIISENTVGVTGAGVGTTAEVVPSPSPSDKTTWPQPSLGAAKLVGATQQQVADFFVDAKRLHDI